MFLLLAAATFLMLRTNRFAAAGLFGALAALTRPLGLVIAIPAAVEAWRGFRTAGIRSRVERVVVVVAPPLGTLVYPRAGSRDRTGDLFDPYRIQAESTHRGRTVDPFTGVWNALSEFFDHDRIGPLLHVGWAVIAIALVVVVFRRLPVSYGLFAAATVVVALVVAQPRLLRAVRVQRVPARDRRGNDRPQSAPRDARVHRNGRRHVPLRRSRASALLPIIRRVRRRIRRRSLDPGRCDQRPWLSTRG